MTPRAPFMALSLLTIAPIPRSITSSRPDGGAVAFFPAVALALGFAVGAVDAALSSFLSTTVVSAIDLALLAVLTGGLHLDGVADTADGLAAMPDRAAAHAALRDSRVGALGAAALVLVILLQWSALAAISTDRLAAIVSAVVLSRWAIVLAVRSHRPARSDGLAAATVRGATRSDALIASLLAGAVVGVVTASPWPSIALSIATCAAISSLAIRRFGGLTGDVYGAIAEVVFAAVLVAAAARPS